MRRVRKLLLVEDDVDVAAGLSELLSSEGFDVAVAERGGEAEDLVERFEPDLVVLDLRLPDLDGNEVRRRLRSRWPQLPIVLSSGNADVQRLEETIDPRVTAFLAKPYDLDTLLAVIERLCGEEDRT
ncbi:MAG: response regulator [Thermoanaerobaculia bacterium]